MHHKRRALVIESGDLLQRQEVIDFLRKKGEVFDLTLAFGFSGQIRAPEQKQFARQGHTGYALVVLRYFLEKREVCTALLFPSESSGAIPFSFFDKVFWLTEKGWPKNKAVLIKEIVSRLGPFAEGIDPSRVEVVGF